jgi:UDPglucose--hexose-1-phosphate uridylyltransferase
MNTLTLIKPDGRQLHLYSRSAIAVDGIGAPSPPGPSDLNSHLRWHPLRGEWVVYATHRQSRTFLPPANANPLAPTTDPQNPTELPAGKYDVAVFDNLFPALTRSAHDPPHLSVPTALGSGACEVVVFTQDSTASLGSLPVWHIDLILEVLGDRYRALSDREDVHYVFPFENRGVEVGVTLHHPHGQIYGYPFVPPVARRELEEERRYLNEHHAGLLEHFIRNEIADERRILYAGEHATAFVPICARYPFEVWVAPRRAVPSLAELDKATRVDLARAFKTVLRKYDGLWQRPFPYILSFHQAPTDGTDSPEAHLHAEFYPAYRMKDRLKYLAGSEMGAGVFTADVNPDDAAAQLRAVAADVD